MKIFNKSCSIFSLAELEGYSSKSGSDFAKLLTGDTREDKHSVADPVANNGKVSI